MMWPAMKMVKAPSHQRGVALITAVLVVTLATFAMAAMTSRQHVDIRRAENIFHLDQALLYVYGGEEWAGHVLTRDHKDNKTDRLNDDWATRLPPIPVEGGQITGQIDDQQSRFNLNNLVLSTNPVLARQRYERLLDQLGLQKALADSLIDWLDGDQNPTLPDGAEDTDYLNFSPAYRTANHLLGSVTELLLIKGYSREVYDRLQPFVCALPVSTTINVNTAKREVLTSLGKNISETDMEEVLKQQEDKGFSTLNDFTGMSVLSGKGISPEGLSVASNHFMLTSQVVIGRAVQEMESLLYRNNDGKVVVRLRRPIEHW